MPTFSTALLLVRPARQFDAAFSLAFYSTNLSFLLKAKSIVHDHIQVANELNAYPSMPVIISGLIKTNAASVRNTITDWVGFVKRSTNRRRS